MNYDSHINQWRNEGYTVISNLLNKNKLNESVNFMNSKYNHISKACKDFGSDNKELEFPSGKVIDWLSIDINLIDIVKEMLQTDDILLAQSDAWCKGGLNKFNAKDNSDQRMHMDYGNNTFLHPADWYSPETVAIIIYLSDTNLTEGGTAVVPRIDNNDELYQFPYINMPGLAGKEFYNNKTIAEEYMNKINLGNFRSKLYEREIIPKFKIGDVLFYRLDTWHRGTPVKSGQMRNVVNLLFKKKECYWINTWNSGFTKKMYYGVIENFFIQMTPEQRSILGIPKPGDKYWTKQTISLLKYRYPKIDISPYIKWSSNL